MSPGESFIPDINKYYRIIEDDTCAFYIQYKKWFKWNFFTNEKNKPLRFGTLNEAKFELSDRIKIIHMHTKKIKSKNYKVHKIK